MRYIYPLKILQQVCFLLPHLFLSPPLIGLLCVLFCDELPQFD